MPVDDPAIPPARLGAAHAQAHGMPRVSLSVEKANPALALYAGLGFSTVRDDGNAVTMLRQAPTT